MEKWRKLTTIHEEFLLLIMHGYKRAVLFLASITGFRLRNAIVHGMEAASCIVMIVSQSFRPMIFGL